MVAVLEASMDAVIPLMQHGFLSLFHSLSLFSLSLSRSLSRARALSSRSLSLRVRARAPFSLLPCNLVQHGSATPTPEAKVLTSRRS